MLLFCIHTSRFRKGEQIRIDLVGLCCLTGCIGDASDGVAQVGLGQGIAADSAGNVYVADSGNNTIRKIKPAGVVTTLVGTAGVAGRADGSGAAAQFDGPVRHRGG
ncbi:NHL repeat protein [Caballeronia arationis]|uniref:hypothetical protein n=1 Tax=Caballeronia arationis TaxID=1777142 RepID=UPI00074CAD2E|nr:NHL repeat protein [Caballeronia arationis]